MTAKDQEMEAVHLPSISAAIQPKSRSELDMAPPTEIGRTWGWSLSGFICLNILMLGCSLVSGSTSRSANISIANVEVYLIFLLLFTIIWMIYYTIYTTKNPDAVTHRDDHAGPIWLRAGLVLFGILSIIMDIFKIAGYVGFLHCDSAVTVVFPVVQLIFTLVQTNFLWIHSKDCVQLQRKLTCCGLMVTLSTNLIIWMKEITEESLHQKLENDLLTNITTLSRRSLYINRAGYGYEACTCSHTSCNFFKEAYYYLYPFNMEYCLCSSAMAYVMWKNVGRVSTEVSRHADFCLKNIYIGPTMGIIMVAAGLTTFAMYEVEMKTNYHDKKSRDKAVMMFFIMNIVIVILMSICTVVGCTIYRSDHRRHCTERNPTRSLDVKLLVASSLGQFFISYFSIVAMVASGAKDYLNRLNLTWGLLMLIHIGLQNYFMVEGLHRQPYHDTEPDTVMVNQYASDSSKDEGNLERVDMEKKSERDAEAHHQGGAVEQQQQHKLIWKRRVLREVCVFLLLGNAILWILPAFGARPQFDHDAESEFYEFSMWAVIVNTGLPFAIFYRMHSVSSLLEVFLKS